MKNKRREETHLFATLAAFEASLSCTTFLFDPEAGVGGKAGEGFIEVISVE